ncbi:hypothetical protein K431DRAFT_284281 [Polychaeton citri CBS 116435]|uniref:Proteasome assembly chaperone 3 n=1 Tax=Polychaeton citri CBS 116435 TaxID=1314669 RepID=A0A9P4Q9H9_9PEZI|nr:hypothetical protein K431DRAFT_284281 [Polychaeton citri CBS 116435]
MSQSPAATPYPYPLRSKTASSIVANTHTAATSYHFRDKILLTILSPSAHSPAHWVHVPLGPASTSFEITSISSLVSDNAADENALLPRSDLTATTVFGGTRRGEDEVWGQTLATTIASAVLLKQPAEGRLLVFGLGIERSLLEGRIRREVWDQLIGLCLECL